MLQREVDIPPFRFWETRTGEGSPVVLIHGLSGSARWWSRNLDALAARHLVSAIDLVGFGRTRGLRRATPLPLSFEEVAGLLARWIESSFDAPVHLVGHSMGGQITAHLAASRPDLVRSVALVAATGIPFRINPLGHFKSLAFPARHQLRFIPVLAADFVRAGPFSVALAASRLLRDDAREALSRISVPTLLVWGDSDPFVPFSYAREMARLVPHARLVVVEGAGHVVMWDEAERFNELLLEYFADIEQHEPPLDRPLEPPWAIAGVRDGIAWRALGDRPGIVLVHGLGIGSAYFAPFARALFRRGFSLIAPDLPGTGLSSDRHAAAEQAPRLVIEWAEALDLAPAVWIGHSNGCQTVDHIAEARPDLVRGIVHLSPIWNRRVHPWIELAQATIRDIPHERLDLVLHAIESYWDTGLLGLFRLARFYIPDSLRPPSSSPPRHLIWGREDPMIDQEHIRAMAAAPCSEVDGGHAIVDSHPEQVADIVAPLARRWTLAVDGGG